MLRIRRLSTKIRAYVNHAHSAEARTNLVMWHAQNSLMISVRAAKKGGRSRTCRENLAGEPKFKTDVN